MYIIILLYPAGCKDIIIKTVTFRLLTFDIVYPKFTMYQFPAVLEVSVTEETTNTASMWVVLVKCKSRALAVPGSTTVLYTSLLCQPPPLSVRNVIIFQQLIQ